MRLASVETAGRRTWGVVVDGGVVEVARHLPGAPPTLKAALTDGLDLDGLGRLANLGADLVDGSFAYLPVVPDADKVLCIGVNYKAHREEMGRTEFPHPTVFTRYACVLTGHDRPLVKPRDSNEFDFEGELAVVIGRRGRHIPEDRALEFVAGWSVFQDATARDWQRHTSQFTAGKNFMGTGGLGPWLVTTDALPDASGLSLVTRVNGREMQRSTTDLLIFGIPKLLSYISTFLELAPGDVIATGTPAGVGAKRNPPVFLHPGDVVEVEVERVGVLRNPVVAET